MTYLADAGAEVVRLEGERLTAMLAKDVTGLQWMPHDDLVYVHSSGVVDTKDSHIARIASGTWDYRRIDASDRMIKVHEMGVMVFGRRSMSVLSRGIPKEVNSGRLAVWTFDRRTWKLAALYSAASSRTPAGPG